MTGAQPIIAGFHPDPSVCRVGDEYFLVCSTFTYFPGVPIFRSTNLLDWEQIGNVLDRPSQLDLSDTRGWDSLGIYAPTLRHHADRFWMVTTVLTDHGKRTILVNASEATGPWSDPVLVDVPGIDPDLAWDDEGTCWVHSSSGGIERTSIDPATGSALSSSESTWSGTGMKAPEAPHLFEREGIWYLVIAEGGTERGHAVSIARSRSPLGPWTPNPRNPILSHRSTDWSIQNTGHADFVQAADGSWSMVFLGVRPRGISPGFHVLGRETFLATVEWVDGWPVVEVAVPSEDHGAAGGPVTMSVERDDFDGKTLDARWISLRRPPAEFASLDDQPGRLTLDGGEDTLDEPEPAMLGRRQQHHGFRATALVDAGSSEESGMVLRVDDSHHFEVALTGGEVTVRARIGPLSSVVASIAHPRTSAVLMIEAARGSMGPDEILLGFQDSAGNWKHLACLDGRYLSTEVAGGFLGRVVGVYSRGGVGAFDWFTYERLEP